MVARKRGVGEQTATPLCIRRGNRKRRCHKGMAKESGRGQRWGEVEWQRLDLSKRASKETMEKESRPKGGMTLRPAKGLWRDRSTESAI
jgi:hypothetical protein